MCLGHQASDVNESSANRLFQSASPFASPTGVPSFRKNRNRFHAPADAFGRAFLVALPRAYAAALLFALSVEYRRRQRRSNGRHGDAGNDRRRLSAGLADLQFHREARHQAGRSSIRAKLAQDTPHGGKGMNSCLDLGRTLLPQLAHCQTGRLFRSRNRVSL